MQLFYGIIFAILVIAIGLAFKILPNSPFLAYLSVSGLNDYLPYINYFVPIDSFIVISEAWLVCLSTWMLWKYARKAVATVSDISPIN